MQNSCENNFRKDDKMENKSKKPLTTNNTEEKNVRGYRKDAPGAVSGINSPGIELPSYLPPTLSETNGMNPGSPILPAFNPPVPNRAWTAMREGMDIDALTEEEKRDLYIGRDGLL